jgi:glutaredoxin
MKKCCFYLLCILSAIQLSAETHAEQTLVHTQTRPVLMLYYSPSCPHSQRVINYLQSINKYIPMKNVYASAEVKEELLKLGGRAQVPCLLIDGRPLYNDDQIIQWLSDNKDLY